MALTSDAKRLLAETIRGTEQDPAKGLRQRLLEAIRREAAGRYRLAVPLKDAGLDETHRRRRERLEAYLDEKTRATKPKTAAKAAKVRDRLLREAEKEAAATLLNRMVTLRLLEARGLSRPMVVTGGWNSKGYRQFREFAGGLVDDEAEGYPFLIGLIFDDLATDLPGLFGDVGVTGLFPIPPTALKDVVETLDAPDLTSVWTDDVTLGWVYQFWIDSERDALDLKIIAGGKVAPHEIASKTQMFTDRYIVEWLLQNSLGLMWLCMCKKLGWTADADGIVHALDDRRRAWRVKRDAGEVDLDALMPIEGELEERWKYFVPQTLPVEAIASAPTSVRSIKLLDPACGSGHFLVIAFDLLASLYKEEARHKGTPVTERDIAESILENNLFGIDIDPRATQIAAASLYLKAKTFSKEARPKRVNLVAPGLQLGQLPANDPAVVQLTSDLKREAGIPEELTAKLLGSLAGVDYLGSLLKVDTAVEDALRGVDLELERTDGQGDLFSGFSSQQMKLSLGEAKMTVLHRLERFLSKHSRSEDLGIRLDGEQLAAGVRFVRIAKDGAYDVVVGNPPYQGLGKTESFGYVTKTYPSGKADLFAAFLQRGLELARKGGFSAMVAMRGWMFLGRFRALRKKLVYEYDLRTLADLDKGAFESMPTSQLVSVAAAVFCVSAHTVDPAVALQPTEPGEKFWGPDRTELKRAAILAQRNRSEFDPRGFKDIDGEPLVYWWTGTLLKRYAASPKLKDSHVVRVGVRTSNNSRFIRRPWEIARHSLTATSFDQKAADWKDVRYVPLVMGGAGRAWAEPVDYAIDWSSRGLAVCVTLERAYGAYPQSTEFYFRPAVSFPKIGAQLRGRIVRYRSVLDNAAPSVFGRGLLKILCSLNRQDTQAVLASLNPSVNTQPTDLLRLPVFNEPLADKIGAIVLDAFANEESARELSIEFSRPGRSAWRYTQAWAEAAVNRPDGAPLPLYDPEYDDAVSDDFLSFAIGVSLGRFDSGGAGLLPVPPRNSLPAGILFLSKHGKDSLDTAACEPLVSAWTDNAVEGQSSDLRTYLRTSFFAAHLRRYEKRPIYFPLSSGRKNFMALVSIHRWAEDTLSVLLADHLLHTRMGLEGELDDIRTAKVSEASRAKRAKAEKRFTELQKLLGELNEFISNVQEIADHGAPPSDDKTVKREVDARCVINLDDGVVVNSAALWPLLEPAWKDPRKWWKQLANAEGKKDFDWSTLAARYFPDRVRQKCEANPAIAVAHGCLWNWHPAKAYAWELRLQDEIGPKFTLNETDAESARKKFLSDHAGEAEEILATEVARQERKATGEEVQEELFDETLEDDIEEESDD